MKTSLNLIGKIFGIIAVLSPFHAFAAGALDHFEVILSQDKAMVGESLDITIRAVDRNNEVITDYLGDILVFSESDPEAEFPNELSENSYTFTVADEGEVKFENAVSFKNEGTQDIYVYDLNDENILGVTEIEISKEEEEKNVEINILSPENGVTIGANNITLSGNTRKNHKIVIIANGEQEYQTTSNSEGVFEKEIENLQDGENTFIAKILNSDENVIGESNPINVKVQATAPELKSIKVTPKGQVEAETEIEVEVYSNAGLSDVKVVLNDVISTLIESQNGIYKGKINAPTVPGKYGIGVILRDEFGNETKKSDVETIFVTEKSVDLNSAPEEANPVVEEITTTTQQQDELDLKISGLKLTELKTKSVLTWDKLEDADSYNIYKKIADNKIELIDNVTDAKYEIEIVGDEIKYDYFAIKAVGKTESGDIIQGDLSEMTKVQTGPELYILLALLAMMIAGGAMYLGRKQV